MNSANIDRKILRPIGTIMISVVGLIGVFVFFNKTFMAILFGLLIFDAIMALVSKE